MILLALAWPWTVDRSSVAMDHGPWTMDMEAWRVDRRPRPPWAMAPWQPVLYVRCVLHTNASKWCIGGFFFRFRTRALEASSQNRQSALARTRSSWNRRFQRCGTQYTSTQETKILVACGRNSLKHPNTIINHVIAGTPSPGSSAAMGTP